MTVDLVIFDCDGVIVDTEPVTDRIISASLTAHGLPIAPDTVHTLFAGGTMKGVEDGAREGGADLPVDWLDRIYGEIFAALDLGVPVIDGFEDFLDRVEAAEMAVAVASNGPMAKMERSLGPSGLWNRLQGRLLSGHNYKPKPDPAMLLHAMDLHGVPRERAVMIDDMPAGAKAAQAAGVRCFGLCIEGSPARFDGTGAEVVGSIDEIGRRLGL